MIEAAMPPEERSSLKGSLWISVIVHVALLSLVIWKAGPIATSSVGGDPTIEMVFPDYKLAKGEPGPKKEVQPVPKVPKPDVTPAPVKPDVSHAKTDLQNAITSPNSDSDPINQKVEKPKDKPQPDALDKMMQDMAKKTPKKQMPPKVKPDDKSLLDALKDMKKEQQSPKITSSKNTGTKTGAGGNDDTTMLSGGQQSAIGDEVRRCYEQDTQSHEYAKFEAHLLVTVDSSGIARQVDFAPETKNKMGIDAPYRALAERARLAVLDSACAKLPVPPAMLGHTRTLRFVFRP